MSHMTKCNKKTVEFLLLDELSGTFVERSLENQAGEQTTERGNSAVLVNKVYLDHHREGCGADENLNHEAQLAKVAFCLVFLILISWCLDRRRD
jgi:hypothetical protein